MPHPRSRMMSLSIGLLVIAIAYFALTACVLQWMRTDLDAIAMPLSAYLIGDGGAWLRCAYYLMAAALACLAWASYRVTDARARSRLASTLFVAAALTLPPVAITATYEYSAQESQARLIHSMAAQSTFLCLVMGMLLLSSRWRRDPHLRRGSQAGIVLAWLAFVQMGLLALWQGAPPGLTQKLLIALILLWLGWVTRQLLRVTR
ncbi:DUF998 domain-containing protein [Dyella humicola]|uniref:DUF998 domain-containing protein n=1 Tax=Dyella humicola TaxID=2992126 RepID=UPI0022564D56|nr:DUF998 domain-containing protein [Dyella humicola]